ncbi:type II toxin-antitoxin system VapB family antitoxin [Kitasatospora acidiphila]|uniref:Type II toxin-antitoxin system VapB family antitoxin n=1 Tax=Kitasatospora acidiphila TaxID=2567942 RepID=A0A540W792_9ACTN|nr:type II toxin-antitoxin system VapB family antitoxin [Kitasatospora acidiphila]TQF04204.1 type II toxin-antitoxin system VapB family antitoxin [Kitasatospora acidiphila]
MTVTTIDLDDDALAKALRFSGGATKKEVVNAALREYAERHERAAQRARHFQVAQQWDYEGWQQLREAEKRVEE